MFILSAKRTPSFCTLTIRILMIIPLSGGKRNGVLTDSVHFWYNTPKNPKNVSRKGWSRHGKIQMSLLRQPL